MTTQFKRLSHSIYECKYHLVFCPKYRYRILHGEVAEYAGREIQQLCKYKDGVEVLEMNIQSDHIHLVLSIAPKYAVSNLMGYLKGKLALRLSAPYENLAKRCWGRHLWSRSYCVSAAALDEEEILKHLRWQEGREKRYEAKQGRLFD